jgi:hypothetical protein
LALPRFRNSAQTWDARLKRLAASIDLLTEKDEGLMRHAHEIYALRQAAGAELYRFCWDFVESVNALLAHPVVEIEPREPAQWEFRDEELNFIQINVRGRILQVEYKAPAELISTEEFRVPYTLAGSVRAFSQELLEKDLIEEQLLFYTVEQQSRMWRFFDARTYRSGAFDREYLISLMEQVL